MAIINKGDLVSKAAIDDYDVLIEKQKILLNQEIELKKVSAERLKQLQAIAKTSDGSEAKKLVDINNQLIKTNQELTAIDKEKIRLSKEQERVIAKLATVKSKENQEVVAEKLNLQKANREIKENVELANKQTSAYRKLTIETNKAQRNLKEMAAQFGVNSKQAKAAQKEFEKFDNRLRAVNNAAKDGRRDVGRYQLALKGVGQQLLGAAGIVGGVDLLIQGFQKFAQTAKEVNDLTRKVTSNFGLTGKNAKILAADINAIASTFDQDYNEVLIAANTVSKELGISGAEATKLIEEGFLKGSNNSGEFLDILKEYPAQFASVGIDAETAFAIINQQVKEGIYSDKGVDAIKEAGLRLRENTKAVQAALAPLDESIRKQIQQEIAAGNSFKAIQLVSKALKDTSLTAEQTQTIIADVFGGPGEDAGLRYLQKLSDINTNLNDVKIQSSESEQATLNLSKSWNHFVGGVSDSDGIFGKVWATFKDLLAGAINGMTLLINIINGGDKAIEKFNSVSVKLTSQLKEQTSEAIKNAVATGQMKEALILANRAVSKGLLTQAEANRLLGINTFEKDQNKDATIKLTAEQKKQLEEQKLINAELKKRQLLAAQMGATPEVATRTGGTQVNETALVADPLTGSFTPEKVDIAAELTKEVNEMIEEENDARRDRELEKEQLFQNAKKQLAIDSLNTVTELFNAGIEADTQNKIAGIEAQAEAEKTILRNQLEQGFITEQQFAAKSAEIDKKARRDAARAERNGALFKIGIDTAAGIVKMLGSSPPPANFINAGLVAAQGILQAALVAAKPLPQFGTGEINIDGKAHSQGGKDVNIEGGESIITKLGTSKAPKTLDAINRGLISDADISGLRQTQKDNLIAGLLMQGNKVSNQMLSALMNLGYIVPGDKFDIEKRSNGQIIKRYK